MADPARARNQLSAALRWGLAVVCPVVAFLLDWVIPHGLFPSPLFITAVMVCAHFGGTRPAVLAFFVSLAFLDLFFIPPIGSFTIHQDFFPSLAQYIVPCAMGVWFIQKRKDVELLLERETGLAKRLQGEQSPAEIGRSVLDYLAPELGAPIAAFYTVEPDGSARRRAGYAFDVVQAPEVVAAGQGLIGQAVTQTGPQIVEVPPDYVTVRSSLGARRPSVLVVVPARDGQQAQAVLELGFFRRLDRAAERLLERIAEPIAIAVRTAAYRDRLKDLLEETRRQAEEIKATDEELRATNEELEERGRVLVESQRKLEEQQVELEQGNQSLQDQARLLEHRNEELAEAHAAVRIKSDTADRANRAKSEFLANMSHELRTPLNSSLILAKLLSENRGGNLTAEQIKFAQTIYEAGNDLLSMIDDILDLAKIEAGKVDLRIDALPLARLRDDLTRTFEPIAAERGLRFEARLADGAPASIQTDAQRVGQILKNLLSNAFKFTKEGVVDLTVIGEGDTVRFTVHDTGIGIPEGQLGAIFEAFRQGDGTTSRKYGGTGLGLSISRDLARMLGGEINVTSAVGQGSTFTLTLPVTPKAALAARPSVDAALPRIAPAPIASQPRPALPAVSEATAAAPNGRSILVVEDDPRFADIVVELARELRFEATIAGTAEGAMRAVAEHVPKGIILDIRLPDHSGLSVLEWLKRDPRTRHVPVHIISITDDMRPALEMGAIGYALKPIQREQIKTALERLEAQFTRSLRRLLVVEDDVAQREAICQLLGGDNVEIVAVGTVKAALEQLRAGSVDCVVLDLSLPDASGYDLLETMAMDRAYSFPSVVVYTGGSLSAADEQRLRKYSSSIIIKSARSPERLLDEVTLFLHQVESELPPERQRMLQRARDREAIFEDRKVLVVEDDVRNVFALTSVLEPKGIKVTIARNGREALEALERDPGVDVVLMDVMMPEMDGLEATRAIRRQPKWAKLPIIALTAKAMKSDLERCLEAGANDYLAKPLDVDRLLALLRVRMPR